MQSRFLAFGCRLGFCFRLALFIQQQRIFHVVRVERMKGARLVNLSTTDEESKEDQNDQKHAQTDQINAQRCLLYTSPSPRDG